VNEFALVRGLHVVGVVLWIGGVAMVTTVLLPAVQRHVDPAEQVEFFERIESRFAAQARWTTALVGITGLWLAFHFDLWSRFAELRFWWMHAMVVVWLVFTVMLFVLEPFLLRRRRRDRLRHNPAAMFQRVRRLHWVLLTLSVITVFGAVAGSHGGL
jgi:uncharacterized membrane protein